MELVAGDGFWCLMQEAVALTLNPSLKGERDFESGSLLPSGEGLGDEGFGNRHNCCTSRLRFFDLPKQELLIGLNCNLADIGSGKYVVFGLP